MQDSLEGGNLRMKLQSINDLMYLYYTILLYWRNDIVAQADPIKWIAKFLRIQIWLILLSSAIKNFIKSFFLLHIDNSTLSVSLSVSKNTFYYYISIYKLYIAYIFLEQLRITFLNKIL